MKIHQRWPVLLVLSMAAVGCGGSVASEQPSSVSAAATRAPVARGAHGVVRLVGDALGDVPLTPSQRADIEKLAADSDAAHAEARAARRELMLAIAAQVEAGAIDRAALQPRIDAVAAAVARAQPADRAALERLHGLLTPDQRSAFVAALESRWNERPAPQGAHPLRQWARDLNLSGDQRDQIKAALQARLRGGPHEGGGPRAWAEARERRAKLLEAFEKDRFVLDEVAPTQEGAGRAARAGDWLLGVAEAALPVLTPEQRVVAAQKIRARADETDVAGPGPLVP
ncbi:MAG TPA: Spy/CpxP family protein refolding chaperone [Polyangiaceae bacterium]|nr:Spy/CpxP family protein refolding chaperone [Polyangiaceae bacterium]